MIRQFSTRSISRTITLSAVGLGLTAFMAASAQAAVIVSSDLTYSTSTKALMTSDHVNVTVSDYTASGTTEISTSNNHFFGRLDGTSDSRIGNREMVATITAAIANNVYGAFTINVDDGMRLDLTSFDIGMELTRGASDETFTVHLRSSIDGFANDIGTAASLAGDSAATTVDGTGSFTGAGLQNLTGTTTFRLYMVSNMGSRNDGSQYIRIMPDIVLNGTVSPVPEPGTLVLAGLGGVFLLGGRRRVRSV